MTPSIETSSIQPRRDRSFYRQIPTIREMIGSLDTLTITGRQHLMLKVVGFIRECGSEAFRGVGRHNERTVSELLECLAAESSRPMPDVRQFVQGAESLVALLAPIA